MYFVFFKGFLYVVQASAFLYNTLNAFDLFLCKLKTGNNFLVSIGFIKI